MIDFTNIQADTAGEEEEVGNANPTVIKIVGCGGCGSSAVNRLIIAGTEGVEFLALNTDLQALKKSAAEKRIAIGQELTKGLGAGGNPEIGEKAAQEDSERIREVLNGSDMVIITAGMGGGTGTGSVPVVADIAREVGALTIAVVTTPFEFEGYGRMKYAKDGLEKLRGKVDSLIVIPNEQVLKGKDKDLPYADCFRIVDNVLCQGVQGISEIITKIGEPNIDFADVRSVMKDQGEALLGVGMGKGENRAVDAAQNAISNPMLENRQIDGAKNILINVTSNGNLPMSQVKEIVRNITTSANKEPNIYWGQVIDDTMDDTVFVTVIATGFEDDVVEINPREELSLEKNEDENIFDINSFNSLLKGSSAEAVEPEETLIDSVIPSSSPVADPDEKKNYGEFVKAPVEEKTSRGFAGRGIPSNINPNDPDVPSYWKNKLDNLSRSIDLTQV